MIRNEITIQKDLKTKPKETIPEQDLANKSDKSLRASTEIPDLA